MKSSKAGVRVVACCIVFLLSESFAQGKPINSRSVTLNGAVTHDYSIHRLKDLGLEDNRVLFYIPSFEGALLLDEADEYHFSTNNVPGRIFLEAENKLALVGLHFTKPEKGQKNPYKNLRLEDIRSLRGIYLEDKSSELVLQLLTYLDPENVFVSIEVPFFPRQEKDEFPPINPEIKFLKIFSSRSLNKTSYAHLKKMHALEFLNLRSGSEEFDLGLLESCTHLAYLNAGGEYIKNLQSLKTLKELRWLNLSRCDEVDNIEFVQNLPELRHLSIYSTPLRDLTPIQGLKHIEFVGATRSAVGRIPQKTVQSLMDLKIVATNVDAKQAEVFAKNNPQCKVSYGWNQTLQKALKGVTHLKVVSGATWISELEDGTRVEDKNHLLFETNDSDDLESLIQYIEIDPEGDVGFCGCHGDPILKFYKGDELAVVLSHHHGERLRWAGGEWPCDGTLTAGSRTKLLAWFDDHGMPDPKKEYEEDLRQEKKNQAEREKLIAAMPTSLARFFTQDHPRDFKKNEIREMDEALSLQYPDKSERIIILLGWYGSGGGSWDSFFAYESVAEELLVLYSANEIISITSGAKLDLTQSEGTARYWARSENLKVKRMLPIDFKNRLLAHCLKSSSSENWEKARNEFGDYEYYAYEGFIKLRGYNGTNSVVVIPDNFDGIPVTIIENTFGKRLTRNRFMKSGEWIDIGESCTNITHIAIPSSITNIGFFAFSACSKLMSISVDSASPNYLSEDGVLMNKEKTALIQYPAGRSGAVSISEGVRSILMGAFDGCRGLTQIIIPHSVTNIGYSTFGNCDSLEEITIPASIKLIHCNAFEGCGTLESVYFLGDAPEMEEDVFEGTKATLYYLPNTTGWGGTVAGRPSVLRKSLDR